MRAHRIGHWPLRLGISGAPGVGKTLLCELIGETVARTLKLKVHVSKEVARTLVKKGVKINTESRVEDYLAFLSEHMRRMRTCSGDLILFDRTMLDVYAFMKVNGHTGGWLESLTDELVRWQTNALRLYFYIPPEFDVQDDGIRIVDSDIIRALDEAILNLLRRYFPDFVTLKGDPEARVDQFLRELLKDKNLLVPRNR